MRPRGALAIFHAGGLSGPARTLAGRLAALGQELEGLTVAFPERGPAIDLYPAAEIAVLPYEPLAVPDSVRAAARATGSFARDVARFRRLIRSSRPRLVVVVTSYLPAALLAARVERVPTLVYAAEVLGHSEGGRGRALAGGALASYTSQLAAAIVAPSRAAAGPFPPAKVTRIPPGLAPLPPGEPRYRDGHGTVAAVVGSVSERRGQDVFLRALAEVRQQDPDAVGLVVGAPSPRRADELFRSRLDVVAAELGLDGAVRFLGAVAGVQDVFASADVVVNPALIPEGFGRVLHEALVAGVPVVSTRVAAVSEVLEHERTALLVEPRDAFALAAAILRLRRDPALAARLVEEGRRRIAELCDEERGRMLFLQAARRALRREAGR